MRHILLSSAVAVVAATLGTSAFAGEGADKDHDKTMAKTSTTQPAHVQVQSETDINDSAMPAGATIHADDRGGTVDTRIDSQTDRSDDAVKARAEIDSDQKDQLKAEKKEAKAEMQESKKELKDAEAEYKSDKKDYERTTAEMDRNSDRMSAETNRRTDRANGVEARGEIDTDSAQTAGSVEVEGEARSTESRPDGSDKEHLKNENPGKPHLSDK